jgi:hypothetical protein
MATNALGGRFSIPIEDLTTPTSTQKYNLGLVLEVSTADPDDAFTEYAAEYIYGQAGETLTAYEPAQMKERFEFIKPADSVAYMTVCSPQVDFTDNYYGFFLFKGKGKCKITASGAMAVGDYFLPTVDTPSEFQDDGASITDYSIGSVLEAIASGTEVVETVLLGKQLKIHES